MSNVRTFLGKTLIALALTSPLAACGGPCNLGEQDAYWNELASVGEGSFQCFVSTQPRGCTLGEGRCVPELIALFSDRNADQVTAQVQGALEKAGFTKNAEKSGDHKNVFVRAKDEVVFAAGKLGDDQVELHMLRKPENATH